MNIFLTSKFRTTNWREAILVLTLSVLTLVAVTLAQDLLRANVKHSAFYFSEALLFSSFWWIFVPLSFGQYVVLKHTSPLPVGPLVTVILLPLAIHLLGFPAVVWVLSNSFYYHTYDWLQTFRYTLSEHVYWLVLFYAGPVLIFQFLATRGKSEEKGFGPDKARRSSQCIDTILVSDGNKRLAIPISEILFLAANSPYINIHVRGGKYVHHETLKSISAKLDPDQFVRVHKSTIVNIKMVDSYATRLNGDYDLTLKNNAKLRVSRNFAGAFKSLFGQSHRLTTR